METPIQKAERERKRKQIQQQKEYEKQQKDKFMSEVTQYMEWQKYYASQGYPGYWNEYGVCLSLLAIQISFLFHFSFSFFFPFVLSFFTFFGFSSPTSLTIPIPVKSQHFGPLFLFQQISFFYFSFSFVFRFSNFFKKVYHYYDPNLYPEGIVSQDPGVLPSANNAPLHSASTVLTNDQGKETEKEKVEEHQQEKGEIETQTETTEK